MNNIHANLLIILDDREIVTGDVREIVGTRRYGDIIFKRQRLKDRFISALPTWSRGHFYHIKHNDDLLKLRSTIEACSEGTSICIMAGKAGFSSLTHLTQLFERLPYAEESFTDNLYRPLIVFFHNVHDMISEWSNFEKSPIHTWSRVWKDYQRLQSLTALDLSKINDFLLFTTGSTATRHFNEVQIDTYYYTKKSQDKKKMLAEYSFYQLVPEKMRPWLIETFDYHDEGIEASYKMLRYYLADAALQWVHGAFEPETFTSFIERLLFFITDRSQKKCSFDTSKKIAREIFVNKVKNRIEQFLSLDEGKKINGLVSDTSEQLNITSLYERYINLFNQYENQFYPEYLAVGHGDPCFSNILYDQHKYLLKLIDPKGATSENDIWTNPLYDLCKISHSVLGDYDFINNGLYCVSFTDKNELKLTFEHDNQPSLKPIFSNHIRALGYDLKIIRLGEASLFLSMLPLHIDYPNKVIAFIMTANNILNEVENG